MATRFNARSESGFALIEAVVSAAVLAVVAMAVLSGIDGATNSSAREKARSIAANLAEQDQERLRAMSIDSLAALGANPPVTVDGVTYKVVSNAEWVTDDQGGTPSCGNSSKNNEYMHITSTVTSSIVGNNTGAVKIDSLVAPSVAYSTTHGTLGVKVVDRTGTGLQGVTVQPTGPGTVASDTTNAQGCVLFKTIPIGTYTINITKAGYVDPDGNVTGAASQKVGAGVVTFKTMDYDLETKAAVSVQTNVPGSATTKAIGSKAIEYSATNAKRTTLFVNRTAGAYATSYTVDRLFPFKDSPYALFTGNCAYESPDVADRTGNSAYWSTYAGQLQMDPTMSQPQSVSVLQPPFNIRLTTSPNGIANVSTYAILQKPTGSTDACVEPRFTLALKTWPTASWGSPPNPVTGTTGWVMRNDAAILDPGMPYGTYNVCFQDGTKMLKLDGYQNLKPGGNTPTKELGASGWVTGTCPTS